MIEKLKEIQSKLDHLARAMLLGVTAILQKLSGLDDVPDEVAKQLALIQKQSERGDL